MAHTAPPSGCTAACRHSMPAAPVYHKPVSLGHRRAPAQEPQCSRHLCLGLGTGAGVTVHRESPSPKPQCNARRGRAPPLATAALEAPRALGKGMGQGRDLGLGLGMGMALGPGRGLGTGLGMALALARGTGQGLQRVPQAGPVLVNPPAWRTATGSARGAGGAARGIQGPCGGALQSQLDSGPWPDPRRVRQGCQLPQVACKMRCPRPTGSPWRYRRLGPVLRGTGQG
mmetsp:Transcript_22665/g.70592  ORF Transcript_22665/g.70592 Transcript_22665/m.70592 type:complete len:229 (-) Transcript_22665:401-1087(-)